MILREISDEGFTYTKFKARLDAAKKKFNPDQVSGLEQRMLLLESFLEKGAKRTSTETRFKEGQLTIVDLTDPFIDTVHANALFKIVTGLFGRAVVGTGKVLVVDEAHQVGCSPSPFWPLLIDVAPSTVPFRRIHPCRFFGVHDEVVPSHWNSHHHQHPR